MADIGKTVKEIWEQSMKAVNKAATNIATSTKQKPARSRKLMR